MLLTEPHPYHDLETIWEYPELEKKAMEEDNSLMRMMGMSLYKSIKDTKMKKKSGDGEKKMSMYLCCFRIDDKDEEIDDIFVKPTQRAPWFKKMLKLGQKTEKPFAQYHHKKADAYWKKVMKSWN